MSEYAPELGQWGFSNTPWQSFDGDGYVNGLALVGEAVESVVGYDPTKNVGGDGYESGVFDMRAYCWCDGETEGHGDGCPPNFVHKPTGLTICWYKYLGRGMSADRPFDSLEWLRIAHECVADALAQAGVPMSNAPAPSPYEQSVTDRFDAAPVPPEVVVETVARALWEADNDLNPVADRGFLWSLMESHGIADRYRRLAAAAIAAVPPSPAEQAVKRVEALAESFDATSALRRALALADELESPRIGADPIATRARRDVAKRLRAALASPAPAPQGEEETDRG